MTTCPMCGQKIPVEGCSEHIALCGLDDETRELIEASAHYHYGQNIQEDDCAPTDSGRACYLSAVFLLAIALVMVLALGAVAQDAAEGFGPVSGEMGR